MILYTRKWVNERSDERFATAIRREWVELTKVFPDENQVRIYKHLTGCKKRGRAILGALNRIARSPNYDLLHLVSGDLPHILLAVQVHREDGGGQEDG